MSWNERRFFCDFYRKKSSAFHLDNFLQCCPICEILVSVKSSFQNGKVLFSVYFSQSYHKMLRRKLHNFFCDLNFFNFTRTILVFVKIFFRKSCLFENNGNPVCPPQKRDESSVLLWYSVLRPRSKNWFIAFGNKIWIRPWGIIK